MPDLVGDGVGRAPISSRPVVLVQARESAIRMGPMFEGSVGLWTQGEARSPAWPHYSEWGRIWPPGCLVV